MSSKLFLGQASNYRAKDVLYHTFAIGSSKWSNMLKHKLAKRYGTTKNHVFLMNNGRSAIAAGLKQVLPQGGGVIINGFTCYAVLQAIEAAGCKVIYADINQKTLNFDRKTLSAALKKHPEARAVLIQNTLGITVNIQEIEDFSKKHGLIIAEDLAHCTGFKYQDGREVGSVGAFAALSFGKGKSLDSITGGALIINDRRLKTFNFDNQRPKLSDTLRARWYPLLATIGRGCSRLGIQKYWYGPLIKLRFIERAVDAKLDLSRRPAHWQARCILRQLSQIDQAGATPIRTHRFVKNRKKVLDQLDDKGFNFREVWYDVPVSPVRYYQQVNFPEKECPVSTAVSAKIINLPTYYPSEKLSDAFSIIERYEV